MGQWVDWVYWLVPNGWVLPFGKLPAVCSFVLATNTI